MKPLLDSVTGRFLSKRCVRRCKFSHATGRFFESQMFSSSGGELLRNRITSPYNLTFPDRLISRFVIGKNAKSALRGRGNVSLGKPVSMFGNHRHVLRLTGEILPFVG